jgi:hypothetical protein
MEIEHLCCQMILKRTLEETPSERDCHPEIIGRNLDCVGLDWLKCLGLMYVRATAFCHKP